MKHYSESFNKTSRLIVTPKIGARQSAPPPAPGMGTLKDRLVNELRVQQDFFPCFDWVFPPPVFPKSAGPRTAAELFAHPSVVPATYSAYLHIPFCKTLCSFCYFRVLPGRGGAEVSTYVDYLLREIEMYKGALAGARCESLYLGGGTPTYLDDDQLVRIFEALRKSFDLRDDAEITVESAPGTLPREKAALLRSLGVNRLSYGIQSLDEALLATMNRFYKVDDAIKELEGALTYIGNINVDTMYGFDDEPDDALLKTLSTFEKIGIPCMSIFALDTQRSVRKSLWVCPPRDQLFFRKIELYQQAERFLSELGYRPLFQNTFAKPGLGSYRHQLRRWENVPLVALGVGAMGYAPRTLYQNYAGINAYYQRLDSGVLPIEAADHLTAEMEVARQVTTQLRFAKLDVREILAKYGVDLDVAFEHLIAALMELGYLEREGDLLSLSKAAAPFNNVLPMLFSPDSFKTQLLGLPEDYIAAMPTPLVLTRLRETQSAPMVPTVSEERPRSDAHEDREYAGERGAMGVALGEGGREVA